MQPQQLFKLREHQSPLLARQSTPAHIRKRDVEACVLTPSISAGRCAAILWAAHSASRTYHIFVWLALNVHKEFPERKKMHRQAGAFWVRRDFVFFFFFSCNARDHGLLQVHMRPPCLIYLSASKNTRYIISRAVGTAAGAVVMSFTAYSIRYIISRLP